MCPISCLGHLVIKTPFESLMIDCKRELGQGLVVALMISVSDASGQSHWPTLRNLRHFSAKPQDLRANGGFSAVSTNGRVFLATKTELNRHEALRRKMCDKIFQVLTRGEQLEPDRSLYDGALNLIPRRLSRARKPRSYYCVYGGIWDLKSSLMGRAMVAGIFMRYEGVRRVTLESLQVLRLARLLH